MAFPTNELILNILRVFALLATFSYASYSDYHHRRVKHSTWILPTLLGLILLNTEVFLSITTPGVFKLLHGGLAFATIVSFIYTTYYQLTTDNYEVPTFIWLIPLITTITTLLVPAIPGISSALPFTFTTPYINYIQLAVSNILLATILGFVLYAVPVLGMGGADFLAFIVIGLLIPTRPGLGVIPITELPQVKNPAVYALRLPILKTITNMGILLIPYLVYLPLRNLNKGQTGSLFLTAFTIETSLEDLHEKHGRIIPTWRLDDDASITERLKVYFSASGVDTFFLRDYLKWRQHTAENPPDSLKGEPRAYLQQFLDNQDKILEDDKTPWETRTQEEFEKDEEFLNNLLEQDTVYLMPGIPLIIPLFGGVLLTVLVGDLMLLILLAIAGM